METTQPEELEKLSDRPNWQWLILERLDCKLKKDGILSVLKKGLSIDDARLIIDEAHSSQSGRAGDKMKPTK